METTTTLIQTLSETDILILLVLVILANVGVGGVIAWGGLQYIRESAEARRTMATALQQQAEALVGVRELLSELRRDIGSQERLERRQLSLLYRQMTLLRALRQSPSSPTNDPGGPPN